MNAGPVMVNGIKYGQIVQIPSGFVFVPATPVRKSSRKVHATADACVPQWVRSAMRQAARAALAKVQA